MVGASLCLLCSLLRSAAYDLLALAPTPGPGEARLGSPPHAPCTWSPTLGKHGCCLWPPGSLLAHPLTLPCTWSLALLGTQQAATSSSASLARTRSAGASCRPSQVIL